MDNPYVKNWEERIREIKNQAFDKNQKIELWNKAIDNLTLYLGALKKISWDEYETIKEDLRLALEIAYSNYRKQKWENSFLGKIKIIVKSIFSGKTF